MKVSMSTYMFAERAWICVSFTTTRHFTCVGFLFLVGTDVLEAVAGVGVGLVAACHWTQVGLFSCTQR